MPKDVKAIQQDAKTVADDLILAKEAALAILNPEDHGYVRLFIETRFNQMINRLNFLAGRSEMQSRASSSVLSPIVQKKEEEAASEMAEDPQAERKRLFLEKVGRMESNIFTLSNEEVTETLVTDDDRLVVRALAKRAALEDYRTADLTHDFFEKIRNGLQEQEKQAENKDATESKLVVANTGDEDDDLVK